MAEEAMSPEEAGPDSPCLSVVMPCYNELATVETAIKRLLDLPFVGQLIVVDDGSTDGTRGVLEQLSDPGWRSSSGPPTAARAPPSAPASRSPPATSSPSRTPTSNTTPPTYARLLRPLLHGQADVVYGSRFLTAEAHRVLFFWHSWATRLDHAVEHGHQPEPHRHGDLLQGLPARGAERSCIEEDGFGFEPEITAKVAAMGCRIFEVGISYYGRTYEEGKRSAGATACAPFSCIGKYSARANAAKRRAALRVPAGLHEADEELASTLHNLDSALNYAEWLASLLQPHLRGRILEVGAGHGTFSEQLAELGPLTASEPSERAVAILRDRLAHRDDIDVMQGDLTTATRDQRWDGIVMLNVLEHIDDDAAALRQVREGLEPGGRLAVLVPAFELLYSRFDAAIGHHRRYRLPELVGKVETAGLQVQVARYVNSVGFFAWLLTARILRLTPTSSTLATTYDRAVIPMLRSTEARLKPPFGQSALVVAAR